MKKLFTLLTLLLTVCSGAWAISGTEKATNTGTSNATITGTCYTLDGKYIAGTGGVQQGNMANRGVKLRTNQADNYIIFTVNSSYTITDFKFSCAENSTYGDEEILAVYIDDDTETNKLAATIAVPKKGASTSADINLSGLNATKNIIIKFNTATRQICGYYELTWNRLDPAGAPDITDDGNGTVTITAGANASKVTYTTDGSTPTAESTTYSAPFVVEDGTTVKAISIGDGISYGNSDVVTSLVTIAGTVIATPVVTSYNGTIKLSCATASVTLGYNTDGSSTYKTYTAPFTILEDATVYVKASRTGSEDVFTSQAVTAVSKGNANKTIYISYGSLDGDKIANGAVVPMNESDDAYGYSLYIDNPEKAYSFLTSIKYGNGDDERTAIKLSNGAKNILYLPTGVKATRLTLYSVINSSTIETISGWKEINGVDYQSGEGDYKNFPMGAFNDVPNYQDNPDVRVYNLGEQENSVSFTNAGSQLGFVIALDVIEPVAITPAHEKTTYVTTKALDFTEVSGLKAYVATAASASAVTIEEVTAVPAGTPLVLIGTAGTEYTVPVAATASAPAKNLLKAGGVTLTGDGTEYILNGGKFYQANAGELAAGKAYLKVETSSARELDILFGGETTGIQDNNRETITDNRFYDLQGRRVAQPQKGLYVVNGKKVIVK